MKGILKTIFINLFVLYVVSQLFNGIKYDNGVSTFLSAGVFLTISSIFIKPLINIMILPINLVTFGVFRWISSTAALYIVTLVVPGFLIERFYFSGYSSIWFDIPVINFSGLFAIILYSFAISILGTILHWLLK